MTFPNMALPLHWDIQRAAYIYEACAAQLDRGLGQAHILQDLQKGALTPTGISSIRDSNTGAWCSQLNMRLGRTDTRQTLTMSTKNKITYVTVILGETG